MNFFFSLRLLILKIEQSSEKKIQIKCLIFWVIFMYKYTLCGPILPCVQTVGEEARPNIIPIHTNGARKGPA